MPAARAASDEHRLDEPPQNAAAGPDFRAPWEPRSSRGRNRLDDRAREEPTVDPIHGPVVNQLDPQVRVDDAELGNPLPSVTTSAP